MTKGTIQKRWKQHVGLWKRMKTKGIKDYRGFGASPLLFFAFDKYGIDSWQHEILFEGDYEETRKQEIFYIEHFNTRKVGYNVMIGGQTGHLGRNLSEDHKKNQKAAALNYWKTANANNRRNQLSVEFKNNNPCKKGNIPWNPSKTYMVTDPHGKQTEVSQLIPFCRDNNLGYRNMLAVANGTYKQHKGFTVTIINNNNN